MHYNGTCEIKRLLILSCSRRKRTDAELLPAVERYDGPPFRVLRRYLRQQPEQAKQLDVYVLSAKYGLIVSDYPIPNYNQRLTPHRTDTLRAELLSQLNTLFQRVSYQELFLSMSRAYIVALDGYQSLLPDEVKVITAKGAQGGKLSQLRDWLYGEAPPTAVIHRKNDEPSRAVIRGIQLSLTMDAVLATAKKALKEDGKEADSYLAWYVEVDNQRVAPKWLVYQLTGLPVSTFGTSEACRVLTQLGVQVKRK